jgi:hypothetical protein
MALPKKGPGRPKGSVNKVTGDIRKMIDEALNKAGGVDYLVRQARKKNPAPFLALVGKCLPKDVTLSGTIGTYTAIPVERRDSDALASTERPAAHGDSTRPDR